MSPFDPGLPGLVDLLDDGAVAAGFVDAGIGGVAQVRLVRAVWEPGQRAVAVYRLRLDRPGSTAARTLAVVEVEPTGVRHRSFLDDPALPGLAEANDGRAVAARLADRLDHPVTTWTVEPVSYRPGEHCVLRYDLGAGDEGEPRTTLFGKVHAAGATSAATTLSHLQDCGRRDGGFAVTAPLAVVPELGLVVQAAAGGTTLAERAFGVAATAGGRRHASEAAGRALAAVQRAAGPMGPVRTLADDIEDVRSSAMAVAAVDPALTRRVHAVLDELAREAEPQTVPVPAHGSFRADHVVLRGERVELIDLDGYGWADPMRDLGNLLAHLRWKGQRDPRRASSATEVRRAVLAGHAGGGGTVGERIAAFEAVAILKVAVRRFRRLAVAEWPAVPELVEAAADLLRPRQRIGAGA